MAEAATTYSQAAASDPQNPAFWLLLAEFSLRYDFQVETLGLPAARNAVATSEGDPEAISALGMAANIAGDHLTGERLLGQALSLDPSSALAWYRYALVLLDLGRDAEAQRALDNAAALDPGGVVGQLADRSLDNLLAGYR